MKVDRFSQVLRDRFIYLSHEQSDQVFGGVVLFYLKELD